MGKLRMGDALDPLQHLNLLLRHERSLSLHECIAEAMIPRARVLDAGCGLGLLSFWASKAGAESVVAVDVEGVELARHLADSNGMTGKIEFFEGDLRDPNLLAGQAHFDLILAMIYLNDPRRDDAQIALAYELRDRYLADGGIMIPDRIRYLIRACDSASEDYESRRSQVRMNISDLEARYSLELAPLERAISARVHKEWFPPRRADGRLDVGDARFLTEPTDVLEVDLYEEHLPFPPSASLAICAPGVVNAFVWTQQIWFRDRLLFSNDSIAWTENPLQVRPGELCTVRFDRAWRDRNVAAIVREGSAQPGPDD